MQFHGGNLENLNAKLEHAPYVRFISNGLGGGESGSMCCLRTL